MTMIKTPVLDLPVSLNEAGVVSKGYTVTAIDGVLYSTIATAVDSVHIFTMLNVTTRASPSRSSSSIYVIVLI